jgi:hypothetical protein
MMAWIQFHAWWTTGMALAVLGSLTTIGGAWLLYRYAPPNLGATGLYTLDSDLRMILISQKDDDAEEAAIKLAERKSRAGFLWIVVGTAIQLGGTIAFAVDALRPTP